MYSSIEVDERPHVIEKCYWPIFKLADAGFPIGLEAPAITLEIINEIDPAWVDRLALYIKDKKIEFIGSGYSQIIGPLVPAVVNNWNQKLGLEVYKKLLGAKPSVALVNEMAYSAGLVDHYLKNKYDAIVMEWNNPRYSHPEWKNEWRYFPQRALCGENKSIPLIWADSIAFQKFQRYSHGEIDLAEYKRYLKDQVADSLRYFPIYSNDVEIFNYRPGRFKTEAPIDKESEWDRIFSLYDNLNKQNWCTFVFPSEVLRGLKDPNGGREVHLESLSQPIPVKKQEKYNINRWALTGRDDLGINTSCYQIYNSFIGAGNEKREHWIELCYLWSSDFRTHITEKRWAEYVLRLCDFAENWLTNSEYEKNLESQPKELQNVSYTGKYLNIQNSKFQISLNTDKGLTIKELIHSNFGSTSILGTLAHGYYDDISFGADYFSAHAVIEQPGEHKVTDLGKIKPKIVEGSNKVSISTQQVYDDCKFANTVNIYKDKVKFKKKVEYSAYKKAIIRPFIFTFNVEAWDQDSLSVITHNGGAILEKYLLKGHDVSHGSIYSSLISSRHGFGNTEGEVRIADKYKVISFRSNMCISALIPSIIYKEFGDKSFFRLQYSAREMDETHKIMKNFKKQFELTICLNQL
jgi:hypothetical protein